MNVVFLQMAI